MSENPTPNDPEIIERPPTLGPKFFIYAGLATVVAILIFTFSERLFMTYKSCDEFDVASLTDPENTILMEVSSGGCVAIETRPDKAPNHVARFKELAREGFYDGIVFHRVIDGFMAQTGDPTGTGSGGSGQNINAEFNDVPHQRGTVSTARSENPNSADSQFFIMFGTSPHLDGQYTVWGNVIEGMDIIDRIQKGPSEDNGAVPVDQQDKIVKMVVASDMPVKKTD